MNKIIFYQEKNKQKAMWDEFQTLIDKYYAENGIIKKKHKDSSASKSKTRKMSEAVEKN